MADNDNNGSGGIGILGVLIGAVIVFAIGFLALNGNFNGGGTKNVSLNVNPPATSSK